MHCRRRCYCSSAASTGTDTHSLSTHTLSHIMYTQQLHLGILARLLRIDNFHAPLEDRIRCVYVCIYAFSIRICKCIQFQSTFFITATNMSDHLYIWSLWIKTAKAWLIENILLCIITSQKYNFCQEIVKQALQKCSTFNVFTCSSSASFFFSPRVS